MDVRALLRRTRFYGDHFAVAFASLLFLLAVWSVNTPVASQILFWLKAVTP